MIDWNPYLLIEETANGYDLAVVGVDKYWVSIESADQGCALGLTLQEAKQVVVALQAFLADSKEEVAKEQQILKLAEHCADYINPETTEE